MNSKIKNITIFTVIAAALILVYIFFIKQTPEEPSLVSSTGTTLPNANDLPVNAETPNGKAEAANQDFLALLNSVKNIVLNDSIFSEQTFNSLNDSSIALEPDGTEGRPNPFAQFGTDPVTTAPTTPPVCTPPQVLDEATNTCVEPPPSI